VEIAETLIGVVHQLAEKGRHDLAWHWGSVTCGHRRAHL
jgi:hypothetical protein